MTTTAYVRKIAPGAVRSPEQARDANRRVDQSLAALADSYAMLGRTEKFFPWLWAFVKKRSEHNRAIN